MSSTAWRRAAAACWIAAAPLFLIANVVVGLRWSDPAFSWTTNNISDLGNVTCGIWDTTRPRYVCSPWHDAMNAAFALTAALIVTGLLLTWRTRPRAARWLLLLGATGLALAGLFPADRDENIHLLAAVLVFLCGNAGLLATARSAPGTLRPVSLVLGVVGLSAAVLFIAQQDLGLGLGTMERLAVFPLPIWATYAGGLLYARGRADLSLSTART